MTAAFVFIAAALAEIAGYFAFWAWFRLGQPVWWLVPGVGSLMLFGWLLTLVESALAGRAYAAYRGIYIAASLLWSWAVEARGRTAGTRSERQSAFSAQVSSFTGQARCRPDARPVKHRSWKKRRMRQRAPCDGAHA